MRVINKNDAFTLDGKQYNDSDIVAFQDKHAYHKRHQDQYLNRLVKGRINLYYFDKTSYKKTYTYTSGPTKINSASTRVSYFYFDKDNGDISIIGIPELRNAVKDKPEILSKLNAYYPKDTYAKELDIEKLVAVVEGYNK